MSRNFFRSKVAVSAVILVAIISVTILSGAIVYYLFTYGTNKTQTPQPISISDIKTPIWTKSDLEATKLSQRGDEDSITTTTCTIDIKPKFYSGSVPFSFKAGIYYWPGPSLEQQTIYYDFGNYKTYFVCSGTASVGAQTYDNQNRLIAEAKLVRYISYQLVGSSVIIDEIHYDSNGQPIFKCTSQIDSGFKTNELNVVGTKIIDYYSVWPDP